MTNKVLTAVVHSEGKIYVAECPEIGTISQGYTLDEEVNNLKEATELYLEDFEMPANGKTLMTTFEAVINA